jgi:predicted transposase YbfD/YdcC
MTQPSAIDQMVAFVAVVHDPRRHHPTTLHALETLLTITMLATIGGAQNGIESEHWGHAKAEWLAAFLDLASGMPSHDTVGRVFAVLDPGSRQQAFAAWMKALAARHQDIVALVGNTLRRSLHSADGHGPIHVVKAWASAHEVGLAQFKVGANTNAMTALPALRRMLHLTGAVVTIDAMGCQGESARPLQEPGADDVLSFKEHQPSLYRDGADRFTWLRGPPPLDPPAVFGDEAQVDGGHGRIETRRVWSTEALGGVVSGERGPGLTSLVMVESIRPLGAKERVAQRYSLSSLPGETDDDAKRFNQVIRPHGEIENRVHWVLDVAMGEDGNRARKGESAQHLALMRKLALNLWR